MRILWIDPPYTDAEKKELRLWVLDEIGRNPIGQYDWVGDEYWDMWEDED